jgi:hypothetical protein
VTVRRGWTNVYVKVRKSRWFNFVNTHPSHSATIREAQALSCRRERVAEHEAAESGRRPHPTTTPSGDDRLAERLIGAARPRHRTADELLHQVDLLGPLRQHRRLRPHIDQILTDRPKRVKRIRSSVTGRTRHGGFWNSDHAGVYSLLKIVR